jgi:uncharacterized protein YecE (DUF72 family)
MDATTRLFAEIDPQAVQGQGRIQIGTSGYSFDDWRGSFYPEKLQRNKWLNYYSGFFPCVEINATYYRTPPVTTFRSMAERTPERFEFWVKVPGAATHGRADFMPAVKQFLDAVKPLREAGKLSGFLAQFPQSFQRNDTSLDRIAKLHDAVGSDGMLAVEFRHTAWAVDETFEFLKRHGIVHVAVDLPPLPDLPVADVRVTAPSSYIRLHGRNSRTWRNPKLGDRYDYEYSTDELKEWLPRIRQLDEKCASTYIFFNNCHAGQAVKNARMLRQLLELELENQT